MRVPQLTDDVVIELILPATTEEWADEELAAEFEVMRDADFKLIVEETVGGNTNAISCARMFLHSVEEILDECGVDPMSFELHVESREPKAAS